jgi:hypothetical protein
VDALVSYLRKLPRAVPAGTRWLYSTGETNLVGVLCQPGHRQAPVDYLSEKIWVPAGMEQQATWILSKTGQEISGCCIQAATRDFARFGQFILDGAVVNGQSIVPDGWLQEATTARTGIGQPGRGYGYQWWTYDDGSFAARGIFGQGIFIDPSAPAGDRLQRQLGQQRHRPGRPAPRAKRSTWRCSKAVDARGKRWPAADGSRWQRPDLKAAFAGCLWLLCA